MKAYKLIILLLLQTSSFGCLGQMLVKANWHHQIYNDIFLIKGNDTTNLTRFNAWENIVEVKVSPDSIYCFVRHKPNLKKSSNRLSLYNLKTFQKIKEIIPGYGGNFEWTSNSQIIHSWGCGTNCANLRVYDLQLKEIFYSLSSGGFKISPQNNFIVQLSMHGDRIWIFDLRSLKNNSVPRGYSTTIDMRYNWEDFKFSNEFEITILNETQQHILKSINLNNVKWESINLKTIGELYEREVGYQ